MFSFHLGGVELNCSLPCWLLEWNFFKYLFVRLVSFPIVRSKKNQVTSLSIIIHFMFHWCFSFVPETSVSLIFSLFKIFLFLHSSSPLFSSLCSYVYSYMEQVFLSSHFIFLHLSQTELYHIFVSDASYLYSFFLYLPKSLYELSSRFPHTFTAPLPLSTQFPPLRIQFPACGVIRTFVT